MMETMKADIRKERRRRERAQKCALPPKPKGVFQEGTNP
jgi:hypothetical protein